MIVKTLTTFILKPLNFNKIYYFLPKNIIMPLYNQFSTIKYAPAIQKFQTDPSTKKLNGFIVQMSGMNDINRDKALDIVLQGIIANKYPHNLLADPKFIVQLKKSPQLYIEAFLFRIDQSLQHLQKFIEQKNENGKKVVVKDINESFVRIFQAIKKIPREKAQILQIRVYKQFATYHINYLYKLVDSLKKRDVLLKASQFYKGAIQKVIKVVIQKQQISKAQKNQEKQEQQTILMQFSKFEILQLGSEIMLQLLAVQSLLTKYQPPKQRSRRQLLKRGQQQKQKPFQFKFSQGLHIMIPYISKILHLYKKIQIQHYNFYFKLKKVNLQLNHHFNMSKLMQKEDIEKQKQSQLIKFQEMYKQIEDIIIKRKNIQERSIQQLCVIMFSLKLQMVKNDKISEKSFKQMVATQIRDIVGLIGDVNLRRIVSLKLTLIVKDVYGVNLEQILGKAPRSLRLNKIK